MTRTREEKLAYARGYAAGKTWKWPEQMPLPPDEHVAALMTSARELAGAVDSHFAVMPEEDREGDASGMEAARCKVLDAFAGVEAWLLRQVEAS